MANQLDYITQLLQASTPQPTGPVPVPTQDQLKSDALLQIGLGLMQPIQPNQTVSGHAGNVIAGALSGMQQRQAAGRAEQRDQAKVDISRGKLALGQEELAVDKAYREAQARRLASQTKADKSKDIDARFKASANAYKSIYGSQADRALMSPEEQAAIPSFEAWHYSRTGELIPDRAAERRFVKDFQAGNRKAIKPNGTFYSEEELARLGELEFRKELRKKYEDELARQRAAESATPATPVAPPAQKPRGYWERQRQMGANPEAYRQRNKEKINTILNFITGGLPMEQRR